ncbi:CbiX/SirB N-terminal domain-containing protein [Sessilibacter sp. MAH4]
MSTNTKALLVMAHGSRAQKANDEFKTIVNQLSEYVSGYKIVEPIFLELCDPSMLDAVEVLYENGIENIDIYPMFFNQGKHVGVDIPAQIQECLTAYPNCTITQLDYFGSNSEFAKIMAKHIESQG